MKRCVASVCTGGRESSICVVVPAPRHSPPRRSLDRRVTTWGSHLFEPGNTLFWQEVERRRPDLTHALNPWDDLVTTEALDGLLRSAGISDADVTAEPGTHPLASPDDFWDVVLGTGYRATIDALTAEQGDATRDAVLGELRRRDVLAITTNVVYGRATRTT